MRILRNIKGALFALAFASPVVATGGGFSSLYVLGDSLSDQGNLFAATKILTYGNVGIPRADHYYMGAFPTERTMRMYWPTSWAWC